MEHRRQEREVVRAYVVIKGSARTASPSQFTLEKGAGERALDPTALKLLQESLEKLGLSVVRASVLSVAVEAPPAVFEYVFQRKLIGTDIGRRTFWAWSESPVIPDELSDTIETVVLPQPAKVMP